MCIKYDMFGYMVSAALWDTGTMRSFFFIIISVRIKEWRQNASDTNNVYIA